MKKKTKIIIGCAVLALVIIAAAITGIKITDLQRQNTFVDQVNKLSQIVDAEYISDIDRDEFNTFIDSRVCKGKYAKLENAVKATIRIFTKFSSNPRTQSQIRHTIKCCFPII